MTCERTHRGRTDDARPWESQCARRLTIPTAQDRTESADSSLNTAAARLQRRHGNRAVRVLHERGGLDAAVTVSDPDGPRERAAEHTADRVMRSADPDSGPVPGPNDITLLRPSPSARARGVKDIDVPALETPRHGDPLEPSVRSTFEPQFGADFSSVRVHTDSRAACLARRVGASAFAIGTDLVFRSGAYDPTSPDGHHLIAHELAHVTRDARAPAGGGPTIYRQPADDEDAPEPAPGLGGPPAQGLSLGDFDLEVDMGPIFEQFNHVVGAAVAPPPLVPVYALLAPAFDPVGEHSRDDFEPQAGSVGPVDLSDQFETSRERPSPQAPARGEAALTALGLLTSPLPGFVPGMALLEDPSFVTRGGYEPSRIGSGLRGRRETPLFDNEYLRLVSEQELVTRRALVFGEPTGGYRFESTTGLDIGIRDWGLELSTMQVYASGRYEDVETQRVGWVRARLGPLGLLYGNDHRFLGLIPGVPGLPFDPLGGGTDQGISAEAQVSLNVRWLTETLFDAVPELGAGVQLEQLSGRYGIRTGIPEQHGTPRNELGGAYDLDRIRHSEIDRGELTACGLFTHPSSGATLELCAGYVDPMLRKLVQDPVHEAVDAGEIPVDPSVRHESGPVGSFTLTIPIDTLFP